TPPTTKNAKTLCGVDGKNPAVTPEAAGTKASAQYKVSVPAGKSLTVRLRFTDVSPSSEKPLDGEFEKIFTSRRTEADEFYRTLTPELATDEKNIMRQALARLLWSK